MASSDVTWEPFRMHDEIHSLPAIGFGTYQINDRESIMSAVETSLEAGFRSYDTAAVYGNEAFLGEAFEKYLPKYELTREDIHVTSKLSNADHSTKTRVYDAFKKTCTALGSEPDLYLIHFPGAANLEPADNRNRRFRHDAWAALVNLYNNGQVATIGVSNFTVKHLEDLKTEYHSDIPVVNQVEWHPYYHDEELLKYCNANCIILQGYQSLGGNRHREKLMGHPIVKKIAGELSVTPAQVLLTWSLQRGVAVIPKSVNDKHIKENIDLTFRLPTEAMNKLNNLSERQQKFAWDSRRVF